jgi:NADP-dependent 3-hydroxy acid dehydrogenase YdfG
MTSTVLITGASQGIGKAIALLFAQQGYNTVLASRTDDRLFAVAQELKALGHSTLAVPTDTKDPQQVQSLVAQALAEYGAIDVLINNAGIYISEPADAFIRRLASDDRY